MLAVGVELDELEFIASSSSTVINPRLFMSRGHFHSKNEYFQIDSRGGTFGFTQNVINRLISKLFIYLL